MDRPRQRQRQRCISLCEDDEVEGPSILAVVKRDPAAADFLISVFMAALNSCVALPKICTPQKAYIENPQSLHSCALEFAPRIPAPAHTHAPAFPLSRYRSTTLVKPFPKRFRRDPPPGVADREGDDDRNDFDRLRMCATNIPEVQHMIELPSGKRKTTKDKKKRRTVPLLC